MKPSHQFKLGARDAWRDLQSGSHTPDFLLTVFDNRDDDYELGWISQCEDPEHEIHPPDYRELRDASALRGQLIGLAGSGLGAGIIVFLVHGFSVALLAGALVCLALLMRAYKLPAQ